MTLPVVGHIYRGGPVGAEVEVLSAAGGMVTWAHPLGDSAWKRRTFQKCTLSEFFEWLRCSAGTL